MTENTGSLPFRKENWVVSKVAVPLIRVFCATKEKHLSRVEPLNNLFISSLSAALDLEELTKFQISHVLVLDTDLLKHLDGCLDYITETLKHAQNKLLVHCFAGHSRSVSVCCAYLMKAHNISYQEALSIVKISRPTAQPNAGFELQLTKWNPLGN